VWIPSDIEGPPLPKEVERDVAPCRIPRNSCLEMINHVPRVIHVSTYPFQLLFELEETDISSFNEEIEHFPEIFRNLNVGYNNGPLLVKRYVRVINPILQK
jgi:hypothetical protein